MNLQGWLLNSSFDFSQVEQNVKAATRAKLNFFFFQLKKGQSLRVFFSFAKFCLKGKGHLYLLFGIIQLCRKATVKSNFKGRCLAYTF